MKRLFSIAPRVAVLALLVIAAGLAPWLFGAVQPWAQLLCLIVVLCSSALSLMLPTWKQFPTSGSVLVGIIVLALAQLLPIPVTWQGTLIPFATSLRESFGVMEDRSRPLSLDPASTRITVATLVGAVLTFLLGARCCTARMLKWVLFAIALNGACLALLGIYQIMTAEHLIYGVVHSNSVPFGPFVNRNNGACYLLGALASAIGLLLLNLNHHSNKQIPKSKSFTGIAGQLRFGRTIVPIVLIIAVVSGIIFSQSRGGILSLLFGAFCTMTLVVKRGQALRTLLFIFVIVGCAIAFAISAGEFLSISGRMQSVFDETALVSDGRIDLWYSCFGFIQDFWITGSGLGTFEKIFPMYDRSPNGTVATHAENIYLQVACEGGLPMLFMFLAAFCLYFRAATTMVGNRNHLSFCAGIMGVFLLSSQFLSGCFDFGLFIPANLYQVALLLGLLIGVAMGSTNPQKSRTSKLSSDSKNVGLQGPIHHSWLQGAFDLRFELILVCLVCFGCFSVPDQIRASALETLPHGLQQHRLAISANESNLSVGHEDEHARLERNLAYRFDDSTAHYVLAESFIRNFELEINKESPWSSGPFTHLADFSSYVRKYQGSQQSEAEAMLSLPRIKELLEPAVQHLRISREACCLNPNVHLRLFHLAILAGDSGEKDIERFVRLKEGYRHKLFVKGLQDYEKGDYRKAFLSWRPCLESKSAYRSQIIQYALRVATMDQLLLELFPNSDWFLLELANKHLQSPEQHEHRERVLALVKSKAQQ